MASQRETLARKPELRIARLQFQLWLVVRVLERGLLETLASLASPWNRQEWKLILRPVRSGPLRWDFAAERPLRSLTQITLARSMETLEDTELKAQSFLYNYYKPFNTAFERIKANRATREALEVKLQSGKLTFAERLETQRLWADDLANEYQAVVAYNNALAGFAYARGTILDAHGIRVADE
jgi:hypothetical protein